MTRALMPNGFVTLLILIASGAFFWAASGDSWAITHVALPVSPELVKIGLTGVTVGRSKFSYHGHLCSAVPECVLMGEAADSAHIALVGCAAATLVAAIVYELARCRARLVLRAASGPYVLHPGTRESVERVRLGSVFLALVISTVVSALAAQRFAVVGVRAARVLQPGSASGSGRVPPPWASMAPPAAWAHAGPSSGRQLAHEPLHGAAPKFDLGAIDPRPRARPGAHAIGLAIGMVCAATAALLTAHELWLLLQASSFAEHEARTAFLHGPHTLRV